MECFQFSCFQRNTEPKDSRVLPVIPSSVTDHQTVYTALKTFQDILKQLSQIHLAVTCDEGVLHIAREITMGNASEFENIVLFLGIFHVTKIFFGYLGKYLRNNGAESIWIKTASIDQM